MLLPCVEKLSGQSRRHGNGISLPIPVLHGTNRFGVGTLLRVAEIVSFIVGSLLNSVVTRIRGGGCLLLLFLFDRVAGQINGDLIACVGAEQFAVFSGTFEPGPKHEMFFVAGHLIDRQPETVTDDLRFFVFRHSLGKRFAVELVLAERLDAFITADIDHSAIFGIVNVNGQFAIDDGRVLHFIVTKENDFAQKTACDALFFREDFRFPEAGHANGPLRTILVKRV